MRTLLVVVDIFGIKARLTRVYRTAIAYEERVEEEGAVPLNRLMGQQDEEA